MSIDVREIESPICKAAKANDFPQVLMLLYLDDLPTLNELEGIFLHAVSHHNYQMLTALAKHVLDREGVAFSDVFKLGGALYLLRNSTPEQINSFFEFMFNYSQHFSKDDRGALADNFPEHLLKLDPKTLTSLLKTVSAKKDAIQKALESLHVYIERQLVSQKIDVTLKLLLLQNFTPTLLFNEDCIVSLMPYVLKCKSSALVHGIAKYLGVVRKSKLFDMGKILNNSLMKQVCESGYIDAIELFAWLGDGNFLVDNKETIQACFESSMTQSDLNIMAKWFGLNFITDSPLFASVMITKAFCTVIKKDDKSICGRLLEPYIESPDLAVEIFINKIGLQTPLVLAASQERWEFVVMIVNMLGRLETEQANAVGYGDVLVRAAREGQIGLVKTLVECNSPLPGVDQLTQFSNSGIQKLLNTAITIQTIFDVLKNVKSYNQGDEIVGQLQRLFTSDISIDCRDHQGYTILVVLALWHNVSIAAPELAADFFKKIVDFLITKNASVDVLYKSLANEESALGSAILNQNVHFLTALYNSKLADPNELYQIMLSEMRKKLKDNVRVDVCEKYFPKLLQPLKPIFDSPQISKAAGGAPDFGFDLKALKIVGERFVVDPFEAIESLIARLMVGEIPLFNPENNANGLVILNEKADKKIFYPSVNHFILDYIAQNEGKDSDEAVSPSNNIFMSYVEVVEMLLSQKRISTNFNDFLSKPIRSNFLKFVLNDKTGARAFHLVARIGALFNTESDQALLKTASAAVLEYMDFYRPKKDMLPVFYRAKNPGDPLGQIFVVPPKVNANGLTRFFPSSPVIDVELLNQIDERIAYLERLPGPVGHLPFCLQDSSAPLPSPGAAPTGMQANFQALQDLVWKKLGY